MDRLLVLVTIASLAGLTARLLQRWRPNAPLATGWSVPRHLDRNDFAEPDLPWLVAIFSSTNCANCALTIAEARSLADERVIVQEVPAESASELHDRYQVDVVPMLVVADADGLVRAHHLGPSAPGELRAVLEEATRHNPPTSPDRPA